MKMQRLFSSKLAEMTKTMDKVKEKAGPIMTGMKMAEAQKKKEEAQKLWLEE